MSGPKYIIIRETVAKSLAIDAGTFALFAGLIGLGVWLDSTAMQWAGFFVATVTAISLSARPRTHFTIDGARKRLDEIEAGL